jgi:hypothetical protein
MVWIMTKAEKDPNMSIRVSGGNMVFDIESTSAMCIPGSKEARKTSKSPAKAKNTSIFSV